MLTIWSTFLLSAWALAPFKVDSIHGQNCQASARWLGPTLVFSDFVSPASDQNRTSCQVVTTISVPGRRRAKLKPLQLQGVSSGENSHFFISVSTLPPKGKSTELKFSPNRVGSFLFEPHEAAELTGRCGEDFKFLTKAAAFYAGTPRPGSLRIDQVTFSIALEPCQGH